MRMCGRNRYTWKATVLHLLDVFGEVVEGGQVVREEEPVSDWGNPLVILPSRVFHASTIGLPRIYLLFITCVYHVFATCVYYVFATCVYHVFATCVYHVFATYVYHVFAMCLPRRYLPLICNLFAMCFYFAIAFFCKMALWQPAVFLQSYNTVSWPPKQTRRTTVLKVALLWCRICATVCTIFFRNIALYTVTKAKRDAGSQHVGDGKFRQPRR
jgi:hypothetical protein